MGESPKQAAPSNAEEAAQLKEKGNESFRNKKYEEAVLYYSHALKLDATNYSLFSNRSSAFFQMEQYYLALEDAKETIRLQPGWAKGHFRKGETALVLQPGDPSVEAALQRTRMGIRADKRADEQIPWVGAGVGIIIGVTIVIADHVLAEKPSLVHPLAMVLLTIAVALLGYAACRAYRSYIKNQRSSMLDPPVDLLGEQESKPETDQEPEKQPLSSPLEEKTHDPTSYTCNFLRKRAGIPRRVVEDIMVAKDP